MGCWKVGILASFTAWPLFQVTVSSQDRLSLVFFQRKLDSSWNHCCFHSLKGKSTDQMLFQSLPSSTTKISTSCIWSIVKQQVGQCVMGIMMSMWPQLPSLRPDLPQEEARTQDSKLPDFQPLLAACVCARGALPIAGSHSWFGMRGELVWESGKHPFWDPLPPQHSNCSDSSVSHSEWWQCHRKWTLKNQSFNLVCHTTSERRFHAPVPDAKVSWPMDGTRATHAHCTSMVGAKWMSLRARMTQNQAFCQVWFFTCESCFLVPVPDDEASCPMVRMRLTIRVHCTVVHLWLFLLLLVYEHWTAHFFTLVHRAMFKSWSLVQNERNLHVWILTTVCTVRNFRRTVVQ